MDGDSSNFGDFLGFTYPRKTPNFGDASGTGKLQTLGTFWGRGQSKFWGFIVVYHKKPQILGMGTGLQLQKCLGMLWGRGNPKLWGYLGKNPRKSPIFGVGTGERISGIFPTLL